MIKNTVYMSLSTIARILTSVVLFVLMAREWGPERFGQFAYPLSVGTLLAMLVDYGFSLQLVRDISRTPSRVSEIFSDALAAKILLSAALIALVFLTGTLRVYEQSPSLFYLLSGAAVLNSFGQFILFPFRGLGKFGHETRGALVANLAHFALISAMVLWGASLTAVAVGFVISRAVSVLIAIRIYYRVIGPIGWRGRAVSSTFLTLKAGLPYGVFVALGTTYFQIDTVIVQGFLGERAVGLYQAAVRVLMAALLVPDILGNVYLPLLASADERTTRMLGERFTRHLLLAGVLGFLVLGVYADPISRIAYGDAYTSIADVLPWFGAVLLLRFVASSYGLLLTVGEKQTLRTMVIGLVVVVSVIGNILLVPRFGVMGAASASLLSHLVLFSLYLVLVGRSYGTLFLDRSAKIVLLIGLATFFTLRLLALRLPSHGLTELAMWTSVVGMCVVGLKATDFRKTGAPHQESTAFANDVGSS